MKTQKINRRLWFTITAILAFPFAIALIIITAIQVLQPYAKRCEYQGKIIAHLEKFPEDCNSCTCNDGVVICTEMDCNDIVNNEDKALETIKSLPEVQEWLQLFEKNPRESELGTPSFETMLGTTEMCALQTGKDEECYIVKAYEQLSGHNATHNWYYVDYEGNVTSEF